VLIILAFALLLTLPSPWGVIGFATCLVLFGGEAFLWHRTVKDRSVAAGAETLIGADATVRVPCRPDGQVQVHGEIWEALCEEGADAGETVRVVGREGLALRVERT
jgi:membrane-bound serine protease (ClpP class)